MRKWLILMSLWTLGASGATVWTWVDGNGTRHYSDTPVPGARELQLPEQTRRATPSQQAPVRSATTSPRATEPAPVVAYRTLQIVSPAQQETVWNIGATLNVALAVEPELADGHVIDVYFDGAPRNLRTTALQFSLPNVFRGTHTIQAAVVDANGRIVQRSETVTFYVQQTSIQNPNNPNAPSRRAPPAN